MTGQLRAPAAAGLLGILALVPGSAQTFLNVNTQTVLLNSAEARAIRISATKGATAYTVEGQPAWLTNSSANSYTTPDTLYFQLASSVCGDCTATVKLTPKDGGEPVSLTIRYSPDTSPAQNRLMVNPPNVTLNNTQARSLSVSMPTAAAVEYTLKDAPEWVTVSSAHKFTTPDTLYFQLANTNCGECSATITLLPATGAPGTPVPLTFDVNAGSSFRVETTHITLAYPAAPGGTCGIGFVSGCRIAIDSPAVKNYGAKVIGSSDNWILLNNSPGSVAAVPVTNGLYLSVSPAAAATMATGSYAGRVTIYNPGNQGDQIVLNVSLLVNPGSIAISPASGAGASQTFTLQVPHPGGWRSLTVVNLLINSRLDGAGACYAAYELATERLLLLDDGARDYQTGANSQCAVRLVSANGDGNVLTLAVNVTFKASFAGKKNIYLAARDTARNNSDWQNAGTWEVRPPPVAVPPRKKKK